MLRRKGRFIRRLRALADYVSLPNACMLTFTADAVRHLDLMVTHLKREEIESLEIQKGKRCVTQLYQYCVHIHNVLKLQPLFPEYFDPGQPDWFRALMRTKFEFDKAEIIRRIESACMFRLEHRKRKTTEEGERQNVSYFTSRLLLFFVLYTYRFPQTLLFILTADNVLIILF